MHPDTIIPYILLALALVLFGTLIAITRLSLEMHREATAERRERSRWSQLFASARRWEERRRQSALRTYEQSKIRRIRTGAK